MAAKGYTIEPMRPTTVAFEVLMEESRQEGYRMLVRLHDAWVHGRNRFSGRPEMLLGVYQEGVLVGVGGLNVDPYFAGADAGRVRHLYVAKAHRRSGIGRSLVSAIIDRARAHFASLNARAPAESFAFYESLGFRRVADNEFVTHRMVLTDAGTGKAS